MFENENASAVYLRLDCINDTDIFYLTANIPYFS